MQISEEIKSRLDIVEVIREYVPGLRPVGVNFTALSPFKREKTPSFVVSPEKQIWHCFSSGKGGDVISFVMEMEGVSFVEALRLLAPKAGITLRKENKEYASRRNRLLDVVDISVNYYHHVLLESPEATSAREYLKNRGLSEETIMEWRIGYSPESWDDIINLLKKRGFTDNEIFLAGMSARKDHSSSRFYNRFRGRIMFPINDFAGNPVGFSARVSPDKEATEVMGKYINSPQTIIYDKSRILFGLDKAKQAIRESKQAIVVEGQMDVITAHQNGFKNIIASSGTALTGEQLKLIKRYTNNLLLSFDMDEAGQMAAERGINEAMTAEMNIGIIVIQDGKDPDEYIKKNPDGWIECVKNAKHIMDYYFDKVFKDLDLEKVEHKREAATRIIPVISRLANSIERDFWIRKLAEKIEIPEQTLRDTLVKSRNNKETASEESRSLVSAEEQKELTREEKLSEALLTLALKFPIFLSYMIENISIDHLFGQDKKIFYKNLIIYYNYINSENSAAEEAVYYFEYNKLKDYLSEHLKNVGDVALEAVQLKLLDKLMVLGDRDFFDLDRTMAKSEIIRVEVFLKESYYNSRKSELLKLIASSEKAGDEEKVDSLMAELKNISDEAALVSRRDD